LHGVVLLLAQPLAEAGQSQTYQLLAALIYPGRWVSLPSPDLGGRGAIAHDGTGELPTVPMARSCQWPLNQYVTNCRWFLLFRQWV